MTFAAVLGDRETGEIVGTGSYFVDPETGMADIAYMVDPAWQGKGLGSRLHAITLDYARRHGVRGFTADVLTGNDPMMTIFRRSPGDLEIVEDEDVFEIALTWPASSR
jgi:RimJ/RimL family protein N-acetyltransferase